MKKRKLSIDIFLFLTLIFTFISGHVFTHLNELVFFISHILLGAIFAILIFMHLRLNGKGWIKAGKVFFRGDRYKKVREKYITGWLLMIIWIISLVLGVLSIGYTIGRWEFLSPASDMHIAFSILGIALIIIHILQHHKQIKVYFKKHSK